MIDEPMTPNPDPPRQDERADHVAERAEHGTRQSFANRIVSGALAQPLLTGILALAVILIGIWSFERLPVDA